MEQACLYTARLFPWSRLISMEQAYFYGAGLFVRSRLISTEQPYFYGAGLFLWGKNASTWCRLTSTKNVHVNKRVKLCPLWATVLNTGQHTVEIQFIPMNIFQ